MSAPAPAQHAYHRNVHLSIVSMHKQGRILWTMGGAKRDDPKEARAHFEIASCEECDSQARLREALGFVFTRPMAWQFPWLGSSHGLAVNAALAHQAMRHGLRPLKSQGVRDRACDVCTLC